MVSVIKREEFARRAIMAHMATFATLNVLEIVMTSVIREQVYVEAVQKKNTVLTVIKHVQEIVQKVPVNGKLVNVRNVLRIHSVLTVIKHAQKIVKQVSVTEITVIVRNAWQVTGAKNVKSVVRTIVYLAIKTI